MGLYGQGLLRTEGVSKSTGPRVIGWYVRCTIVHWSIWYIVRHVVRRLL